MKDTKVLVEVGIMVALAVIIEMVFKVIPGMIQGGTISISLLPIIVVAWRRGVIPGMVAGLVFSLLNMWLLDGYNPSVLIAWGLTAADFYKSAALDYLLAFSLVGLAGLVKQFRGTGVVNFIITIVVGYAIRYFMHFLSGIIIFGSFAGEQAVWLYSLIYNGTYILPSVILASIVGAAIYKRVIVQLELTEK